MTMRTNGCEHADATPRGNGLWALSVATVAILSLAGCGPYCRDCETTPLTFECEGNPPRFTGEIHFDQRETFDTFLRQQCIPSSPAEQIDEIVDSVDFLTRAVFVAVGPAAIDNARCVDSRELDRAAVCSDGLKITFRDEYSPADNGCPGSRWTVAFTMRRDDLRAALVAGESVR